MEFWNSPNAGEGTRPEDLRVEYMYGEMKEAADSPITKIIYLVIVEATSCGLSCL